MTKSGTYQEFKTAEFRWYQGQEMDVGWMRGCIIKELRQLIEAWEVCRKPRNILLNGAIVRELVRQNPDL